MSNDELNEKLEMVNCFVTESRELLDDVEPQIIALEKDAVSSGTVDEEILNAIFRLFHSLKGAASFLDLQTVIRVTHKAETLLDIFRSGRVVLEPGHVDLLIRTSDFVRKILDTVEQQLNDEGFESEADVLVADLQKTIASITGSGGRSSSADMETAPVTLPDAGKVAEEAGENTSSGDMLPDQPEEMSLSITPEMIGHFVEEGMELLDEAERVLLSLEKTPGDLECAGQAFRALHSFKGNAGFLGYADLEEVSHHAETLLDRIRSGEKDCDPVAVSFLLIAIDTLRDGMRQISIGITPELSGKQDICQYLGNLAGDADRQSDAGGLKNEPDCLEKTGESCRPEKDASENPKETGKHHQAVDSKKAVKSGEEKEPIIKEKQLHYGQQVIRVDLEKLDKLLDLVGELVIAEAMVANNQDLRGLELDHFEKAVLQLEKITRDIQEVTMALRMIPLSGTFRKMVRLVRDLSQKMNKKVDLEIIGEETEVDKTIIEQISDPLVHLIRNAVDHGIESPEERVAMGKPEAGRVTIEAKHSAGEVWITIEDDGKGLDRAKIMQKGIERGLVSGEELEMKDEEVWRLVFEPGFSTADKVSNISGRGVGMDVVKRNIEKLRGRVDIRSEKGAGTVFAIRIPLTLAIIEGMVVKVGQNRYTIPINSIKESLQPAANQVTRTPDKQELVNIRAELLPVIRLHELYQVKTDCLNLPDGILVVVENSERKCCLFVDEVIGQQQIVIKGLSSYLGHVKSVSGCAILGDGDISMILDIDDLINSAEAAN